MSVADCRFLPLNLTVFVGVDVGQVCERYQLVLGVVSPLHLDLKPRHQNGHAHLLLTGMEHARYIFRHSVGSQKDDHVSRVLSLDGHGGAIAPIDHSLNLVALSDGSAAKQQDCCQ